jgi:hypothetical protein
MSHSQFHSIDLFILRHAWLNLWDKRMLLAESTRLLSLTIFRRKPTRLRRLGVTPAFVVVELLSIMWDRILKEFRKASFRFQTMSTYREFLQKNWYKPLFLADLTFFSQTHWGCSYIYSRLIESLLRNLHSFGLWHINIIMILDRTQMSPELLVEASTPRGCVSE